MAQGLLTVAERQDLLTAALPASDHDEAFTKLTKIVNEYEDENSGVPYAPEAARVTKDGRIYPPGRDEEKASAVTGARRYRTRGHHVFIGENGAIAFEHVRTRLRVFSKPGADGEEVGT